MYSVTPLLYGVDSGLGGQMYSTYTVFVWRYCTFVCGGRQDGDGVVTALEAKAFFRGEKGSAAARTVMIHAVTATACTVRRFQ